MSVTPNTPDLIAELAQIRLDENLSYSKLSALIGVPQKTLHRAMQDRSTTPIDRTLHRIKLFVESRRRKTTRAQAGA